MKEVPKSKRFTIGWYNEGIAHMEAKDYEEALTFMERALEHIPDHPDFLLGKGDILFAMERYEEAFESYRKAVKMEPHNRKAWLKSGLSLIKLHRFEDALEIIDHLLKDDRFDGELWLARGIVLIGLKRTDEARDALRNARRFKPDQPSLWLALASLEDNDQEAIKLLERGHRIDPSNLDILLAMAERYHSLGLREEAERWWEQADRTYPAHRRVREMAKRYNFPGGAR